MVDFFAQFLDAIIVDIVIVAHQLVNAAVWCDFDDTIGYGVDKFVVVRCKKDVATILLQVVIERLNTFHIQVIGRGIQNQTVSIAQLQSRISELRGQNTPEAKAEIQKCLTQIGDLLKGAGKVETAGGDLSISEEMGFHQNNKIADEEKSLSSLSITFPFYQRKHALK